MDNMDPEVKTHLECTYTGHLGIRARDKITQIRVLQALQGHAKQSESQVIGTRKMVSNITSTALLGVPGYATTAVDDTGAKGPIPALKSQAEATIQQHIPMKDTAWWHKGNCFGCNTPGCHSLEGGDVVCPHRDCHGVRELAQRNYKKLMDEKKESQREEEEGARLGRFG